MKKFLASLNSVHLSSRFFLVLGGVAVLFAISFTWPVLFPIAQSLGLLFILFFVVELYALFAPGSWMRAVRLVGKMIFLGEDNTVRIHLRNGFKTTLNCTVYDELPEQFQERDFQLNLDLKSGEERILKYQLRPRVRGEYNFGVINVLISTLLRLVLRRLKLGEAQAIPCYPSIPQMKQFELQAFARVSNYQGIKKMRRLGHSYEFEQIKHYVQGDDFRSVNWKATSRRKKLMVNQYQEERAQKIYSVIDKSRSMHMPFNGLSLLDYAINTSLVISNIALKKHDRAGLITFSNKIGSTIKAEKSQIQIKKILHALYKEKEQHQEADYNLLYRAIKNMISSRSLLFLFLNFESPYAMERALPILRKINRMHLLVVVVFENTELIDYSHKKAQFIRDIYTQTLAQKLIQEKKQMVHKLRQYGIQTVITRPEELSLNSVNKYLELKARGLI